MAIRRPINFPLNSEENRRKWTREGARRSAVRLTMGLLFSKPRHSRRELVGLFAVVEGGEAGPHGPRLEGPGRAVRQRGAVESCPVGNPHAAQGLPHLLAVHPFHLEGEDARLAEQAPGG